MKKKTMGGFFYLSFLPSKKKLPYEALFDWTSSSSGERAYAPNSLERQIPCPLCQSKTAHSPTFFPSCRRSCQFGRVQRVGAQLSKATVGRNGNARASTPSDEPSGSGRALLAGEGVAAREGAAELSLCHRGRTLGGGMPGGRQIRGGHFPFFLEKLIYSTIKINFKSYN